ncbi:BatA domain-containing protein [Salinimicrobium tongyeongense]|uniref:BatA domain-containing protein n=1 Tax=Salinimicrobium tongyeongense TaxID=2809707 RepID=A0ABY6NQE6_9FLAO|nr:BatA domain-containing protein [Salinimicrobium tongyeongense]UZH55131.1 BatA domain-containing protein [Salinimicrobium tongyeongense]
MYFKHPELLYALAVLVIPILVHLFQLRKFRSTPFTNVRFLKKAVLQTRKSSRLKKFLVLCTRLLMLACLVLAFAQPYFPPASGAVEETKTLIYLDNSYSMQARGSNGILLKRSVQDLLENIPENEEVTLFTNTEEYRDITAGLLRQKLQETEFSPSELSWEAVSLKAQNLLGARNNLQKNFIAISDFQHLQDSVVPLKNGILTHLVQLSPEQIDNVTIDTAWITNAGLNKTSLEITLSVIGDRQEEVAVGIYNANRMLARKTVDLQGENTGKTTFNLDTDVIPYGRIEIEDNGLQFDNRLYFSINEVAPVKVVVVGDKESEYLQRIFGPSEFELSILPENNLDYNALSRANLVFLNEPEELPFSLVSSLEQLMEDRAVIVIIPPAEGEIEDYNLLLRKLDLPLFGSLSKAENLITDISFEHPLYRSVFNEKVSNFEYPAVQTSYDLKRSLPGILEYQNGAAFLLQQDNIFVFTAALNRENSNFKNSPLIVPTFYNIGNTAISRPQLYNELGKLQKISLQAELQKDEILKLSSSESTFIPQQQSFSNKVELRLEELPKNPGHYDLLQDKKILRSLSFNVPRTESDLVDTRLKEQEGILVHTSVPNAISYIKSVNEVNNLWKWFVIFTLVFLLAEILILKFLK